MVAAVSVWNYSLQSEQFVLSKFSPQKNFFETFKICLFFLGIIKISIYFVYESTEYNKAKMVRVNMQ